MPGEDAANQDRQNRDFDLSGYFESALGKRTSLKQLQNTNWCGGLDG